MTVKKVFLPITGFTNFTGKFNLFYHFTSKFNLFYHFTGKFKNR